MSCKSASVTIIHFSHEMHSVFLPYSCISCQVFTMMRVSWLLQARIMQIGETCRVCTCKPNSLPFGLFRMNKFRPSIFHSDAWRYLVLCQGTASFPSSKLPVPALRPEREWLSADVGRLRIKCLPAFPRGQGQLRGQLGEGPSPCGPLWAAVLADGAGAVPKAGWGDPPTPQELTECDWLIDLEAAQDPVHVPGVSEAVSSYDDLKRFWKE